MDGQGWHNDPSRRHELRWWDGSTWTSYVADEGVVTLDDAPPPMAPPPLPPVAAVERVNGTTAEHPSLLSRIWQTVRARPLWARIAAVLVIVLAVLAVFLTGGLSEQGAGILHIDGLGAPNSGDTARSATAPEVTRQALLIRDAARR